MVRNLIVLSFCLVLFIGCEAFQQKAEGLNKSVHGDNASNSNTANSSSSTSNQTPSSNSSTGTGTSSNTTSSSSSSSTSSTKSSGTSSQSASSSGASAGITLKSPADGATGVSVLPEFAWECSNAPSSMMFQLSLQGSPVYFASVTPAKSFKFKLLDPSVQGGGAMSMTGRLEPNTKYTWEVTCDGTLKKSASFTTGQIDVQVENPMLKSMFANMKAPYKMGPMENLSAGQWVEHEVLGAAGMSTRSAIVGEESDGFWYETRTKTPQMEYVMKLLIDDSEDHLVKKAYVGTVGGKGKEIGISDESTNPETSDDYTYDTEDLDSESVTVPAGSFDCSVKQIKMSKKDGSYSAESKMYTSDEVPLNGLVKTTSTGKASGQTFKSEMVLKGKGNDAESELEHE